MSPNCNEGDPTDFAVSRGKQPLASSLQHVYRTKGGSSKMQVITNILLKTQGAVCVIGYYRQRAASRSNFILPENELSIGSARKEYAR
jgi:hypothetical protein